MLWIRADGAGDLGLGHIMRTLAIAEIAARDGIDVRFVTRPNADVRGVLELHGMGVHWLAREPYSWHRQVGDGDFVVLDGPHLRGFDTSRLRERGARVGVVDDVGEGSFDVDVLLNPNPMTSRYTVPAAAELLLGPEHALIRQEFRPFRRARDPQDRRLLQVLTGGSDAGGLGNVVLRSLPHDHGFARARLILGPAAPPPGKYPLRPDIEVLRAPRNLAETLDESSAVITAAGSMTWELLYLGVAVAAVPVVQNQIPVAAGISGRGAGLRIDLGAPDFDVQLKRAVVALQDPALRTRVTENARRTVDGEGAERFLSALRGRGRER